MSANSRHRGALHPRKDACFGSRINPNITIELFPRGRNGYSSNGDSLDGSSITCGCEWKYAPSDETHTLIVPLEVPS